MIGIGNRKCKCIKLQIDIGLMLTLYPSENPSVKMRGQGRLARPRADRRNTVDCALLNQMIIEPSIDESKRNDKRQQALLRESERDIKMAINVTTIQRASMNRASGFYEERAESLPQPEENPTTLVCLSHNFFFLMIIIFDFFYRLKHVKNS